MGQDSKQQASVRRAWFDAGAQAFARSFPGYPYGYVCPQCALGFTLEEISRLTKEDVPPKSSFGRPIILTCNGCNSKSGAQLDVEMQKLDEYTDFLQGRPLQRTIKARVTMGGATSAINFRGDGNSFTMESIKRASDPSALKAQKAYMESLKDPVAEPRELQVDFGTVNVRRARIGWLRAGYLAAFAKFGYRYVFHRSLDPVRKQIMRSEEAVVDGFSFTLKRPEPEMKIAVVENPMSYLAIIMGRNVVALPDPKDDAVSLYARFGELYKAGEQITVTGTLIPWPTGPEFVLDV
jgi:hypothetical protein